MRALVLSGGAAHGAFQAGAIYALSEVGWIPDVVCGASVGAINTASVVSGTDPEYLCDMWREVESRDVYRLRPLAEWLSIREWNYVMDTKPLRRFLKRHVSFEDMYRSDKTALCFSVDVETGSLKAYANRFSTLSSKFRRRYRPQLLDIDALMASTAIPLVFPWAKGGWDGALLQYAPMRPVVALGATEIVLISTEVSASTVTKPEGLLQTALQVVDISSKSALRADIKMILDRNLQEGYRHIDLRVISPTQSLGYSKLNFSSPYKNAAISHGRIRTYEVMGSYV